MAERRVEAIDVFRGLAITLVVLFHFTARLPPAALNVSGTPAPPVFFGWIGVYFFFAISGYCIYLTLERSATLSLFLARRFSRIYPAFAAAAVLLFLYGLLAPVPSVPEADFHAVPSTVKDLLLNLVLLGDGRWVNGSFWSIAVEVKFYVLLAGLAAFIPDRERLARVFTSVSLLAAPVWMAAMIYADLGHSGLPQKLIGLATIAPYLPFFALGILARTRQTGSRHSLLTGLALVEALAVIFLTTDDVSRTGLIEAGVATVATAALLALLLAFAAGRKLPHIPYVSTALARVGFISFSWYLIHENLGVEFLSDFNRFLPASVSVALAMLATLTVAYVFSELVEWRFRKPAQQLALAVLDRLAPSRLRRPLQVGSAGEA